MASRLRALIVDDDASIRSLLISALAHEGFVCDAASDGEEAWERTLENRYDLVITDLAMPCRHGHSLAVGLLPRIDRPIVVVLTGVLDHRIAKDLLTRGIDDIVFKPVHMQPFAVKMRLLVDRREQLRVQAAAAPTPPHQDGPKGIKRLTEDEFQAGLKKVARIPPVSKAAIEAFNLTLQPDAGVSQIAAAVQREPALLTDILRLANSSFFNPSVSRISDAEQAVMRLGQRRTGEIALTTAAFFSLSTGKVPFFSLGSMWKKCMAMGLCVEMLGEQIEKTSNTGNLFCAAVLQPIGRLLLASVFPEIYGQLLKRCETTNESLAELEGQVFPENPGEVVGKLLALWGIPSEVHLPLKHVGMPFDKVSQLSDPLRRRVELIKTAGVLGEIVTNQFNSWDLIDLPSQGLLKRLGVRAIDPILQQCRADLKVLSNFGVSGAPSAEPVSKPSLDAITIAYKTLHNDPIDFVSYLLSASGVRLVSIAEEIAEVQELVVINAINAPVHHVAARIRHRRNDATIILADSENEKRLRHYGRIIVFPCSYRRLIGLCTTSPQMAMVTS